MIRKKKMKYIIAVELLMLSVVFAVFSLTIDVRPIGPNNTEVGFAGVNKAVSDALIYNDTLYTISQLLGYFACAIAAGFALLGLIQLIKRRNLFKVDSDILALGGLLFSVFSVYVLFEVFPLNYRPIIMPGETEPEASFPSSHTMLAIVVFIGVAIIIKHYIRNKTMGDIIVVVLILLSIVAIATRFFSGVHWLTDIIAGILISLTLLQFYIAALYSIKIFQNRVNL